MCGFVKYASAGNWAWLFASPGHDSLVTMPNQRAVRHWREALQIAIKPRLVGREPTALEAKRRYGSAGGRELVSDRVLRKFLPCDAQQMSSRERHEDLTGNSRDSLASSHLTNQ